MERLKKVFLRLLGNCINEQENKLKQLKEFYEQINKTK